MADPTALRLGWMLAALGFALAPAVARLPAWAVVSFTLAMLWRLAALRLDWRLPPGWLRLLLAAAGILGVLFTFRSINGLEPGGALLVVMAAMKVLETRAQRDIQVLAFIGFFIVLTQLLHDQPIWTLPWLVIAVAGITLALLQGVRGGPPLPWRQAGGLVARMLAFSLPVALVLFLLFPRVPGPFWALPSQGVAGMTGLDDEMSPGTVSRLIQSDEVAFRVNFDGPVPPPAARYWRGPVLERFDGWTWRELQRLARDEPRLELRGPRYRYRMVIEAHGRPWLLALDYPARWSERDAYLTHGFQLVATKSLDGVRAIDLESWPEAVPDLRLDEEQQARLVRLPEARNPRTLGMAQALRASVEDDAAFVDAVLQLFRDEEFVYTLRPPALSGGHPVDDFLFRTRRGFCEHYASAFTVLARAAGIPARVVTGYQGGELNPYSNRLVVRQSDAHAWSEVWLAGRGWVRIDPTGAIAPQRIESSLADALPDGETLPGAAFRSIRLLRELNHSWDALNSLWTDWVLGYGPERQFAMLERLGLSAEWRTLIGSMVVLVAVLMLALALWLAWQLRGPSSPEALRLYGTFCERLARQGLARAPSEGPRDFAARVAQRRPELASQVRQITDLYLLLRYEPAAPPGALGEMRRELRSFRP